MGVFNINYEDKSCRKTLKRITNTFDLTHLVTTSAKVGASPLFGRRSAFAVTGFLVSTDLQFLLFGLDCTGFHYVIIYSLFNPLVPSWFCACLLLSCCLVYVLWNFVLLDGRLFIE